MYVSAVLCLLQWFCVIFLCLSLYFFQLPSFFLSLWQNTALPFSVFSDHSNVTDVLSKQICPSFFMTLFLRNSPSSFFLFLSFLFSPFSLPPPSSQEDLSVSSQGYVRGGSLVSPAERGLCRINNPALCALPFYGVWQAGSKWLPYPRYLRFYRPASKYQRSRSQASSLAPAALSLLGPDDINPSVLLDGGGNTTNGNGMGKRGRLTIYYLSYIYLSCVAHNLLGWAGCLIFHFL